MVPSGAVSLGSPTTCIAPSARVSTSADPSVGLICQHFAVTTRASGHYWDRAQSALGKKPAEEQVFGMARWTADRAVDMIRDRFGWDAVGYGSVVLGPSPSVPDEFRELAEKDL